jgi:hypothetical protein
MALDLRVAQTTIENALRDAILYALGRRLPSVASVAGLRSVGTRGDSSSTRSDDDLIAVVAGTTTSYRWSSLSTAADDGSTVIQPTDVTGNGRWLSWTSPLRYSSGAGVDSVYLHEITSGVLKRVILLDERTGADEINELLAGQVPAVVIEATDDSPTDATMDVGHRWVTDFRFTVACIAENLRDRRQAAQGSLVPGESAIGANALDGLVGSVLGGTQMQAVVEGLMGIRLGPGRNWISDNAQRKVFRERDYIVRVTVENPNAPNDYGPAEEVDAQALLVDLGEHGAPDVSNYVASGFTVPLGAGLVKGVASGVAFMAGVDVDYAGGLATFAAYSDTYRDLLPNGTMVFVAVTAGGEQPAVTATALRIGVTTTDGSSVLSDRIVAVTQAAYGNPQQYPLT